MYQVFPVTTSMFQANRENKMRIWGYNKNFCVNTNIAWDAPGYII